MDLKDVKEGGLIFSLPMDICLVHKSTEKDFNEGLGKGLNEATAMAAKLMRERSQQQQSKYYHYIQVRFCIRALTQFDLAAPL